MPSPRDDPALAGLFTVDVLLAWLAAAGAAHDGITLYRGPTWPSGVDRAGVITLTPGPVGGDLEEVDDTWHGFQAAFRGRQRTDPDADAERLCRVAHRRILAAARDLPARVRSGGGWVRLMRLETSGNGPTRMGPTPDRGARLTWSANYLLNVIEE